MLSGMRLHCELRALMSNVPSSMSCPPQQYIYGPRKISESHKAVFKHIPYETFPPVVTIFDSFGPHLQLFSPRLSLMAFQVATSSDIFKAGYCIARFEQSVFSWMEGILAAPQ